MGVYHSTPKTEKISEDGENDRLRYGLSCMQGWRPDMEDAHAALPDLDGSTSFFGVYDGHGGKVVAKFCAKHLHTQVLKNEAFSAGDLSTSVQKAFLRMDEMMKGQRGWRELAILGDNLDKFCGMLEGSIWSRRGGDSQNQSDDWVPEEGPHSDFTGPTSGSTACVALIRNNKLIVANVGDSRCVISRKGQAYNLSRDHIPELEAERDRIVKAGGFFQGGRINGSLNLARAIGDMEFKKNKLLPADKQIVTANPEINNVKLCDDDEFIILACDGIWDCMSSQQVVDFIHKHINSESSISVICEKVLDRCLSPTAGLGAGCDNMTMILVQFKRPVNKLDNEDKASCSEQRSSQATAEGSERSSSQTTADEPSSQTTADGSNEPSSLATAEGYERSSSQTTADGSNEPSSQATAEASERSSSQATAEASERSSSQTTADGSNESSSQATAEGSERSSSQTTADGSKEPSSQATTDVEIQ